MNRGIFITFEGTEGAGKTTLIQAVEKLLKEKSRVAIVKTREPGGVEVAEKIRGIILNHEMHPKTELFLYEAARAEHLAHVIEPALRAKKWVLCDRFTDSTVAYQGMGRGLPLKEIHQANQLATSGLKPDLTVLVKIDPAAGLARAREITRFERAGVVFQTKVLRGFLASARREPKRWFILPVGKKIKNQWSWTPPEVLAEQVCSEIYRRILRKKWDKA